MRPSNRLDFPLEMIRWITVSAAGQQERVVRLCVIAVQPGLSGASPCIDELDDRGLFPARHHVTQRDKVAVEVQAQCIVVAADTLDSIGADSNEVAGFSGGNLDSASCARPGAHQHLDANLNGRAWSGRCIPLRCARFAVRRADEVAATIRVFIPIQQRLGNGDPSRWCLTSGDNLERATKFIGSLDRTPGLGQNVAAIDALPGDRRSRGLSADSRRESGYETDDPDHQPTREPSLHRVSPAAGNNVTDKKSLFRRHGHSPLASV